MDPRKLDALLQLLRINYAVIDGERGVLRYSNVDESHFQIMVSGGKPIDYERKEYLKAIFRRELSGVILATQ